MRNLVATTTICAVLFCIASAYPQNIPNKYDNVNIDAILSNDRVVNNYIKCLLDKGSCTQEGRDLKSKFYCFIITCFFYHMYINSINTKQKSANSGS